MDSYHSNNEVVFHFALDGEKKHRNDVEFRPAMRASVFTQNDYLLRNTHYDNCMYGVFLEFTGEDHGLIHYVEVESFEIGAGLLHVATGTEMK